MACKRKLEVEDFESINEPVDTASIHGMVSELSPIKKDVTVNSLMATYMMVNLPCA